MSVFKVQYVFNSQFRQFRQNYYNILIGQLENLRDKNKTFFSLCRKSNKPDLRDQQYNNICQVCGSINNLYMLHSELSFPCRQIRIAGNFRVVQIFAFFEGRAVNAKIKIGRNSHAPVFHMQSLGWVWFIGIETRILQPRKCLLRALEPFHENLPLYVTQFSLLM